MSLCVPLEAKEGGKLARTVDINLVYSVWLAKAIVSGQLQLYRSWKLSLYSVSEKGIKSLIMLNELVTASVLRRRHQPKPGLISRQPHQVTLAW